MADAGRKARARARLDQPVAPRRGPLVNYDPESFGQSTETVARFLGTGRYLVVQSAIIVVWIVSNVVPGIPHFDKYPFGFLTLVLSLQAAYAAPLILLAQNRQDDRDRINMDDDRAVASQNKAEVEYLAREIAAIRVALGEVATRDFLRSELYRIADGDRGDRGGRKDRDKGGRPKEKGTARAGSAARPEDRLRGRDGRPAGPPAASDLSAPVDAGPPD